MKHHGISKHKAYLSKNNTTDPSLKTVVAQKKSCIFERYAIQRKRY